MSQTQGSRVKQIRKHYGLSQKELADKIDVDQSAISLIESKGTASTDVLYKIHSAYNINMSWLISGDGEMLIKEEKAAAKNEGAVFLTAAVLYDMWRNSEAERKTERGEMIKVITALSDQNTTLIDQLAAKDLLLQSLQAKVKV